MRDSPLAPLGLRLDTGSKAPAVARSNMRGLLKALWVACSLLTGGVPPVSSETRRVILLFDERQELPGLAAIDAEFVKALNAPPGDRVEIYREQVDASRFDDHYSAPTEFHGGEVRR